MVVPRALARFNRRVTNPILSRIAGGLPGFAMIEHVGRRSGRRYRTPVLVFGTDEGYLVALTYGPGCDWVRNVLVEGGCTAVIRGQAVPLSEPVVEHDPRRRSMPVVVRQFLGLVGVTDFLRLRRVDPSTDPGAAPTNA